jgi:hypothetical protein
VGIVRTLDAFPPPTPGKQNLVVTNMLSMSEMVRSSPERCCVEHTSTYQLRRISVCAVKRVETGLLLSGETAQYRGNDRS